MVKGMFNFVLLLIFAVNGCSNKDNRHRDIMIKDKVAIQKDSFLSALKPIEYIKNIETGEVERFVISFDTTKHILKDSVILYKIKVTDKSDSLYLGLKDDIIYMYDETKKYMDKAFILKSENKNYYSFFCGNDYRVDSLKIDNNNLHGEDVYNFYMTKLTSQQGHDYFYDTGEYPNKVFRKIVFSKRSGIISAELYDREKGESYLTTDLKKEP